MKANQILVLATALCAASAAQAGGWRLSVGPAFRARMKTEMHGAPTVSDTSSRTYTDRYRDMQNGNYAAYEGDVQARPDWADDGLGTFVPVGSELYAISADYTESTVRYDGTGSAIDSTDYPSSLGVKAKVGYDFYENETFSVGLDLRFAGYWNMKSSASGRIAGSKATTTTMRDWWYFEGGPYPMDGAYAHDPYATPPVQHGDAEQVSSVEGATTVGRTVNARIRADLYQIGLGPTVTWHALSWLDAYAGVAALCNIASLDFDAGSQSSSETQCRFGVAAEVGLIGYLTENLGIYGEVGYEWIDGFDASVGNLNADVDFSSLMVSAGVVLAF